MPKPQTTPQEGSPAGPAWRKAKSERNWLVYRLAQREDGGKPRKLPVGPSGRVVDPKIAARLTLSEAQAAAEALGDGHGVGYLPREGSAIVGLDLDGAVGPRGVTDPQMRDLVSRGYWEFSPSGTGLRGLIPRPADGHWTRDKGGGYGYMGSESLFFTVTFKALHPGARLLEDGVSAWPVFRAALSREEASQTAETAEPTPSHWLLRLPLDRRREAVRDALSHIDLHALKEAQGSVYAEWLEICFAVFRCRLPDADRLLDEWSRTQPDYDPEEDWSKRRPRPRDGQTVGPATLVHHARQGGWDERPWRDEVQAAASEALGEALRAALSGGSASAGIPLPEEAEAALLRPLSAYETEPRIPPFVVRGMFTRGVAGTWVGPGGVSKTSTALLLGAHVAAGLSVGGREVAQGPVVLLSKEDDVDTLRWRSERLIEASLPDAAKTVARDNLIVADLLGLPLDDTRIVKDTGRGVEETPMVEMLLQMLTPIRPSLVFLDPASAWGAGEHLLNTAEAALMFAVNRIARTLDCAVVVIHHVSQAAARDRTRDAYAGRGGSALADNGRFGLTHYEALTVDFEGDAADDLPAGVELADVENGRVTRIDTVKLSHDARPVRPLLVKRSAFNPWRLTFHCSEERPRQSREERAQEQLRAREEAVLRRVRELWAEGTPPTRRDILRDPLLSSRTGTFPREDREVVMDRLLSTGRLTETELSSGGGRPRRALKAVEAGVELDTSGGKSVAESEGEQG